MKHEFPTLAWNGTAEKDGFFYMIPKKMPPAMLNPKYV
jgi:hypothetical protein